MILHQYQNGNALVKLHSNGTRVITFDDKIKLDYPLNIDIRLSKKCAFGMNPATGKAVCSFCHESATTDGSSATVADIDAMFLAMQNLPKGMELAVGINQWSPEVEYFLSVSNQRQYVVNVTINQGTLKTCLPEILKASKSNAIKGIGISYRKGMAAIPDALLENENTVVHVISGIDEIDDVKELANQNVKKILVLGEKDFGFNLGKVQIKSNSHFWWYRTVHELFRLFDVVSFDNLALEQLNVRRFVKDWDTTYQHEYSFYCNAVDGYFSPSSRSNVQTPYANISAEEYFKSLFPQFN